MIKILKNYFFAFILLIVFNFILISTTGNGYFMYLFFYLYGILGLIAFANILLHIGSRYKGTGIYILAFVFLILIGTFLTYYGGELSSKLLLYNSKRNFPSALKEFVSLGEDPISVEGKEIIPFSYYKWFDLENYTMSEKNELIALYRDSRPQEGDLEVLVRKFDTAGEVIDSLSFHYSKEKKSKVFLIEDCLIDVYSRTYNKSWFVDGNKEFLPMKLVEGSQKWNFQQVKDFHYNRTKDSPYCHIIKNSYWSFPDKGDFPESGDPQFIIVFLKDNQLYYYITSYDITDDFYFYNEKYVIKFPEHTSSPLLLAYRNKFLYNEDHLVKGEKSSQRTHIDPVYYLDKMIECRGLEPLHPSWSFEVGNRYGELYYRLKIEDKILPLKMDYRTYGNHERSIKYPTYYWKNDTETIEECKYIYLYSNKNLKYYLLHTPLGFYIVK